jgi:hypothetical protein
MAAGTDSETAYAPSQAGQTPFAVSGHSVIMRCAVCPRHRDRKSFCALFTPQAVGITPDIDHGRMVQDQNGRSQHGDPKDLAAFAEALFEVRIRPARS